MIKLKKIISILVTAALLLVFSLTFQTNEASAASYPGTKATVKAGDIVVTKTTNCKPNCKGITGHAGIVIDSTYIAHISGPGAHPSKISISSWFKKYTSTKVVRTNSKYKGKPSKAASWAAKYLKDYPKAKYSITPNLSSKDPTYCSKLVYQAYYYGTGYPILASSGIIHPYAFINKVGYSGMGSIVASVKW